MVTTAFREVEIPRIVSVKSASPKQTSALRFKETI